MPSLTTLNSAPPADSADLSPVEVGVIDFFVSAVKVIGMPKSLGEIYGLLFISQAPLTLDQLTRRLSMSKGSASQGLRLLRTFGAVRAVYQPGDRRDHFTAEIQLKRLVAGFMREEILPRLGHGEDRLNHLTRLSESLPEKQDSAFQRERLAKLNRWAERSREVIPLLSGLLE